MIDRDYTLPTDVDNTRQANHPSWVFIDRDILSFHILGDETDASSDVIKPETVSVSGMMEDYDLDTKEGLLAGLRESWKQAMQGDTRPISDLWNILDNE